MIIFRLITVEIFANVGVLYIYIFDFLGNTDLVSTVLGSYTQFYILRQVYLWEVVCSVGASLDSILHSFFPFSTSSFFVSILILNLTTLKVMMISLFQRESSTTSPRLRRQLSWGRWRLWTTIARSWPSRSWRRTSTITHTMTASKQARNCARWFSRLWLESSDQLSSSSDHHHLQYHPDHHSGQPLQIMCRQCQTH